MIIRKHLLFLLFFVAYHHSLSTVQETERDALDFYGNAVAFLRQLGQSDFRGKRLQQFIEFHSSCFPFSLHQPLVA